MSIPTRLSNYLDQHGARYEVIAHAHSASSAETARTSHVPPHRLAKSVVLEDSAGRCVMAVVPSDKAVMLHTLADLLGRSELRLVDEARIASLFGDCDRGALPPFGMAWGIETVVDDEVEAGDVVYMEGGDHERVLRMSREQFHELMGAARRGRFSRAPMH